ncbi:hypothetical protein ABW19_dt0210305 [Dactylella cylindrospora]|nr:hypothetical protein ABW19_dt0210305 [Dactylella cylindrospora]
MTSRIHLVRHAESVHNVTKDLSLPDPPLTPLGHEQSKQLGRKFPNPQNIGIILTSPLRRAIQTSLSAFHDILDKQYFPPEPGRSEVGGVKLVLYADVQERSNLGSDIGSPSDVLKREFPRLDHSSLSDGWQIKEGIYSTADEVVEQRANRVREHLRDLSESLAGDARKDIVIVTHGVFMKFLSGEPDIDLPKAGWKSYRIGSDSEGKVILIPSEDDN